MSPVAKNTPEQQIGDAWVALNDNDGDITHSVTEHALLTLSSLQAAVSVYVLFYSHWLFTGRRCTSHSYIYNFIRLKGSVHNKQTIHK